MSAATTLGYKLTKRIKSEGFDTESLPDYVLSLQVGIIDFQFCVTHKETNQCLLLEEYRFENVKTINNRLEVLKTIFSKHPVLMVSLWGAIRLSIKTHKFSLVPDALFVPDYASDYLTLNAEIKVNMEDVYFYRHISGNAVDVFAVDKRLVRWIKSVYPLKRILVISQCSAWLEGILKYAAPTQEKSMYCLIDRGMLHIAVTQREELLYYNQFAARKNDDYLKYMMLVVQELKLDPKTVKVTIWGAIKEDAPLLGLMKKYIRNVSLGTRPSFLGFEDSFTKIADHYYFDVFSISQCK